MPAREVLEALARTYLQRERDRLGVTEQERAGREATDVSQLRQAQARRIAQQLELAPAEQQSEIELRGAQTEATRALAGQREMPKPDARSLEAQAAEALARGDQAGYQRILQVQREMSTAGRGPETESLYPAQTVDPQGRPGVTFLPKRAGTAPLPEGSAFATDIRAERKAAVTATTPLNTVETLANQAEAALGDFENTSILHPIDKAVAQSSYKNLLQALAVPWGRLLGDTRISEEDRLAYARSVGEPSFFLKEIAPQVARQRLQNLRIVIDEVRKKYGPVLEGTAGLLAPVGGGTNLLGGAKPSGPSVDPAVQRILDMIRERNAGQ